MSIKLSPLFSDGMILQRNAALKIRGFCGANEFITINFAGKTACAKADENGFWICEIGEFETTREPLEMDITSGGEKVTIRDILIGDVWLCSGQSNMELMLNRVCHNYPDVLDGSNPLIRQFKMPQIYDFNAPRDEFALENCGWEIFSPFTARNFTAAGYFFAQKLYERYNVPIGLYASAVGGTPVSAWMSRHLLKNFPNLSAEANKCRDGEYIKNTTAEDEKYSQDYHRRLDEADLGLKEKWASADYDNNNNTYWEEIPLCEPVKNGSGAYWYRKTIELPESVWGKKATIFLGTCADMDEVFINGEKIGAVYYRYPPREYGFVLPKGKLTIAVRLLCFGGAGGFTAGKNYFIATDSQTINIDGIWKRRLGAGFENKKPQTFFQYKPTGLYNGMICPLLNTALKGVIWYQGESDAGDPDGKSGNGSYSEKLTAMIKGWREAFKIRDLPFIMTQLAYWGEADGSGWERFRAEQKKCLSLPKTGLALAYDLGEHNDLHPQNKRDVGERLARIAMRVAYGEKLPPNLFEMYNI